MRIESRSLVIKQFYCSQFALLWWWISSFFFVFALFYFFTLLRSDSSFLINDSLTWQWNTDTIVPDNFRLSFSKIKIIFSIFFHLWTATENRAVYLISSIQLSYWIVSSAVFPWAHLTVFVENKKNRRQGQI